MRNARIEQDIQNVIFLLQRRRPAFRAGRSGGEQSFGAPVEPDIGAFLFEDLRYVVHDRAVGDVFAAGGTGERGDRDAPGALAGNAPVGTVLDHAVDPLPSPFRNPLYLVDGFQRLVAQFVGLHADEPLLGGAEDDRFFAAPAVRVGVADLRGLEQRPDLDQLVDHALVGGKNLLAAEEFDIRQIFAVVVDRIVDLQPLFKRQLIILLAVAGGGMNAAGAGFQRHMLTQQHDRITII